MLSHPQKLHLSVNMMITLISMIMISVVIVRVKASILIIMIMFSRKFLLGFTMVLIGRICPSGMIILCGSCIIVLIALSTCSFLKNWLLLHHLDSI